MEDDIEIVLEDEPGEAEPTEPQKKVDDPDAAFKRIRAQLETDANARVQREASARQSAEIETARAKAETKDARLSQIGGAIEQAEAKKAILKERYSTAFAAGDADTLAEIQMEMAETAANLSTLRQGKTALESAPTPEPPTRQTNDPVETLARNMEGQWPKSAAWIRAHPEYARDPRLTQKMVAAHNFADSEGITPDTDEYFDRIEGLLGLRIPGDRPLTPDRDDELIIDPGENAAKKVAARVSDNAPPAAPVSRGGQGNGSTPTRITLSPAEREIADAMGMTYKEYAKNKADLKREGKLQ